MFNKILLTGFLTLSFSYGIDDFSSERLLGIEVGYANTNTNVNNIQTSTSNVEFGFKIGAQNDEWRTTISANFITANGRDYQRVMINFDRFVWASLYETDSVVFKPYLGAHVGWVRYTDDISLTDNGLAYGGQVGLSLNVLNEVDFDLAYKYTVADLEQVADIASVTFGVNYMY